jgi:hypothetical protein
MSEAMVLKLSQRGHLEWHHMPARFHKNLQIVSNVDKGTGTQTGR